MKKRITVLIPEEMLKKIEEAMKQTGIEPRSVFIRAAINHYVQEVMKK